MSEKEEWREHPIGIMVSNLGRVETEIKGKYFGYKHHSGYKIVGWKGKSHLVHRLVYEAFIGIIPEGLQVNHIDENKTNNRIENLNLMTCKENVNWGSRNQRVADKLTNGVLSKPVNQFTKDGKFVKTWLSIMDAERICGFNHSHISKCCIGKRKTAYGYIWRYK